jgi:signal transduction histidine kinase
LGRATIKGGELIRLAHRVLFTHFHVGNSLAPRRKMCSFGAHLDRIFSRKYDSIVGGVSVALVALLQPRQAHAVALESISLSATTFGVGVAFAFFLYILFRSSFERWFERVSRSRMGNFLPQMYHQDSLSDTVYGYYFWDREDGFEWISPHLRKLLRIDDTNTSFEAFRRAFKESDFQELEVVAEEFKREERGHYSKILHLTRADVYLECIGVLRQGEHMKEGFTLWFRDMTSFSKERKHLKKENKSLKRKMRKWQAMCDKAPFPMWLRDAELNIIYCNPSFAEIVDDGEQVALDSPKQLELNAQIRELAKEAQDAAVLKEQECHIISKGKRRLFHIMERPLVGDDANDDIATIGYGFDLHAKEEVESELKRYISAQSDLLESSASAMAVYGADQRLKNYNQAFVRLWKLDESWLDQEPSYGDLLEHLREKRRIPEQANFPMFKQESLSLFTKLIRTHEEYYYLPDGRVLRVIVIPHALGGLLFAYEDVTDRLALERNYNTLIAVQRASLDNLHEGVAVFGEDGRLKLYNPAFAKLWHLDEKMLDSEPHISNLVQSVKDLLNTKGHWEERRDTIAAHVLARENTTGRLYLTNDKVVDWHSVPLPDGAIMMAYYDMTASILMEETLREKNKALEEADKVKTEFLASMSYELRSPLTSIMGFSEALGKHYFGAVNEKQQEYIDAIHQSSNKLMGLINNILDLASIEAGYMQLNLRHFHVKAMLEDIREMQREAIKEAGLRLRIQCPRDLEKIYADESRLKQIIFNLLHNAIKFSDRDSTITISVSLNEAGDDEPALNITVKDHGEGMSEEEQLLVFERFYKGASVRARKSGAGLGLSMVKRFTELHGGRVELASEQGEGTSVTCMLPLHAKEPKKQPRSLPDEARAQKDSHKDTTV